MADAALGLSVPHPSRGEAAPQFTHGQQLRNLLRSHALYQTLLAMHEDSIPPEEPYRPSDRRPLKSREWTWSQRVATWLAGTGISPNTISILGMAFALVGGAILLFIPHLESTALARVSWVLVAAMCQLRLLANLFDGMVAIATNRASPTGELYNEIPDRVSDVAILVAAGYTIGSHPALGFSAAILAVATAYIRAVGKAATGTNDYCGPMAKPQRMAIITIMCVVMAILPQSWWTFQFNAGSVGCMAAALSVVAIGALITCIRRLLRIARRLHLAGIERT